MPSPLTHTVLKEKQRALRDGFPETVGLRVHRSISWIGRAEQTTDDPDARFLFLWIAFNAAYAEGGEPKAWEYGERSAFGDFFDRIVALDNDARIRKALLERFSGPIASLLKNRFVFHPFWQYHNGIKGYDGWKSRFHASLRKFAEVFKAGDTARVLCFVFDRLYVLRNQMIHGGATWNSEVNRAQVTDGADILGFLVPVFVDIMIDNPAEDWGRPFYPVVS